MTPRTKGWLQIVAAVICFSIAFTFFPPTTLKDGALKAYCISNLKQLSTAQLIYLDDHDQRFQSAAWSDPILPYTKNPDLLTCPKFYKEKDGKYGYAMNFELVGANAKEFGDPETTPLFFEIDALAKDVVANVEAYSTTRHSRSGKPIGGVVSYLDTRTKFVKVAPLKSPP